MNPLESRVIVVPTVPHYPSLAKALQNDMLESAIAIREALYTLPDNGSTLISRAFLENALEALDFSHFIPIANNNEMLYQEYVNLKELVYDVPLFAYKFNKLAQQFVSVEDELIRRDFWTEIVLEDMTAVVMSIEPENFNPIENTYEALRDEYHRLEALYRETDELSLIWQKQDVLLHYVKRTDYAFVPVEDLQADGVCCRRCGGDGMNHSDATYCSDCNGTGIEEGGE